MGLRTHAQVCVKTLSHKRLYCVVQHIIVIQSKRIYDTLKVKMVERLYMPLPFKFLLSSVERVFQDEIDEPCGSFPFRKFKC